MAGTTNKVKRVESSIPPMTAVPIAIRPLHPSPVANIRGKRPSMVETLVIKIGRSRCTEASLMAVILSSPFL